MTKVVDITRFKERQVADRSFHSWRREFGEAFHAHTKITDLSDEALAVLIKSGVKTQALLYDLIMGVLGLGRGAKFFYLNGESKMKVLDISIFLMDQIRFECMRRLGWLTGFAAERYPLLALVERYPQIRDTFSPPFPTALQAIPRYDEYQLLPASEREVFIRKQIPLAIDTFLRRRLHES
jgi:hypothetical protein